MPPVPSPSGIPPRVVPSGEFKPTPRTDFYCYAARGIVCVAAGLYLTDGMAEVEMLEMDPVWTGWPVTRDGWVWLAVTFSSYSTPAAITAGASATIPSFENDGYGNGIFYYPLARISQGQLEPLMGGTGPIHAFPPLLLGAP